MFQPVLPIVATRSPTPKRVLMLKGNDLIGQPVLHYGKDIRLGVVTDLIFDYLTNQMLAFVLDKPGWRAKAQIIPWSGIQSVRAGKITAWSKNMIVQADRLYRVKQVLERPNLFKGMPVITDNGWHLGVMIDLYLNEPGGTIAGYEVKGGAFATDGGTGFIPAPTALRVHQNAAYVPKQIIRQIAERPIANPKGLHLNEQALGRWIRQPVSAGNGNLLAVPGQVVTEALINLARAYRKEAELLRAVGLTSDGIG